MKRQLIIGLILVVLIGVCFGAYFGVDTYQKKKAEKAAEEAAALQLSDFQSDDVTKLILHTPDLDYTIEKNTSDDDGDSWLVASGDELHINTYYIDALCTYGCSLTATKDLGTADADKLETYGLSDPVSITYYTGDADKPEKTLYIGKQNPTKESFYVMHDDDDHVYLADANNTGYLYVTRTQLRYRYLMDDKTSDITQISLERDGQMVYNFSKTDNNADWKMTAPIETPIGINNAKLSSAFISLQQLEADDFGDSDVTPDKYAEYGFDQPAYRFQFTQSTGETTTLLVGEYDPLTTSYIKCLHVETNEILIFDSSYLSFLQTDTTSYMVSNVYKQGIENVSGLTVQYHGSFNDKTVDINSCFTIDNANSSYTFDGTAITANDAAEAFKTFYTAVSELSYESLEANTEIPADTDPALRLTYTLLDGSTHTVELVKRDDTTYWAFIDGTFTHAVVRQRALSGENKLLEAYTALQKAAASAAS